jgi:hypothetical protein
MMRHFSSSVGVQRLGPNQCRLEMSLLMQPSIYVPFGVRHMVSGQVRTTYVSTAVQDCFVLLAVRHVSVVLSCTWLARAADLCSALMVGACVLTCCAGAQAAAWCADQG